MAAEKPPVPAVPETVQEKDAAVTAEVRPMDVNSPLQIASEGGVATTLDTGFTVT